MDIPELAIDFVNDDHKHAAAALDELAALGRQDPMDDVRIIASLADFLQHTREHFDREQVMMEDTAFPPRPVHVAEHQRVLAELEAVLEDWPLLEVAARSRYLLTDLPQWFRQHLATMDTVTCQYAASMGWRAGGARRP